MTGKTISIEKFQLQLDFFLWLFLFLVSCRSPSASKLYVRENSSTVMDCFRLCGRWRSLSFQQIYITDIAESGESARGILLSQARHLLCVYYFVGSRVICCPMGCSIERFYYTVNCALRSSSKYMQWQSHMHACEIGTFHKIQRSSKCWWIIFWMLLQLMTGVVLPTGLKELAGVINTPTL